MGARGELKKLKSYDRPNYPSLSAFLLCGLPDICLIASLSEQGDQGVLAEILFQNTDPAYVWL